MATDTAYLKTLLNFGYEHNHIMHGTFVTAGPKVYVVPLCQQDAYLNSILVLLVEGISQDAIWQDIEIEKQFTTLGDYILDCNDIEAIECTNKIETDGK
eukprot:479932-Ditylum_brightwellii.AAC.1